MIYNSLQDKQTQLRDCLDTNNFTFSIKFMLSANSKQGTIPVPLFNSLSGDHLNL